MEFPRVERYRSELRRRSYRAMSDEEIYEVSEAFHSGGFFDATRRGYEAEIAALLNMLLAERVPPDVFEDLVMRYVKETLRNRGFRIKSLSLAASSGGG